MRRGGQESLVRLRYSMRSLRYVCILKVLDSVARTTMGRWHGMIGRDGNNRFGGCGYAGAYDVDARLSIIDQGPGHLEMSRGGQESLVRLEYCMRSW